MSESVIAEAEAEVAYAAGRALAGTTLAGLVFKDAAGSLRDALASAVEERPGATLALATGLGILFGLTITRSRRRARAP